MKRSADPAGGRLWAIVAATVRPLPGRSAARTAHSPALPAIVTAHPAARQAASSPAAKPARSGEPPHPPQAIEAGRHRRLRRGTEPLTAFVDLHGLDQDRARLTLTSFITRVHAEGRRMVLVVTGKGALGGGVLRRRVPEWLADPPLRGLVAGLSEAHRRHGGHGALYVALKRPRPS